MTVWDMTFELAPVHWAVKIKIMIEWDLYEITSTELVEEWDTWEEILLLKF